MFSAMSEGLVAFAVLPGTEVAGSLLAGNIHVGLAAAGAAVGVGLIGMAASTAVGRNPGASTKILVQSILSIAFAEAIVFYALFLVR
jgi:F-type H+-transporting ATPase subunit c